MIAAVRRASRPRVEHVVLALIVLAGTVLITRYGLRNHIHQNDEDLSVFGARFLEGHFPGGMLDQTAYGGRGPERLTAFALAAVNAVMPTTTGEFKVGHGVLALAWCFAAVPVYALARGLALRAGAALVVAALTVIGPWAIFGTTFLNTALGYVTFALLLYAMWRTTVRPSPGADVLVLVAAALVVGSRVGHAPFVLALAPAIVVQSARDRGQGTGLGRWAARFPGTLWRAHLVLFVAAAVALIALAVKGQSGVLGSYGSGITGQTITLDHLWGQVRVLTARIAQGTAIVPLCIALPWLGRELVRPRSREGSAFALLTAGILVAFFFVFYFAAVEDRYLAVTAPLVYLAAGAAIARREASIAGTAIAGVLLARDIVTNGHYSTPDAFGYFIGPGGQFFDQVVLGRLRLLLPFGDGYALTIALVVAVTAAVLLAARTRLPRATGGPVAVALLAGLLLYMGGAAGWAMSKWTSLAQLMPVSLAQQSYIDRAADGAPVRIQTINPSDDPGREELWRQASFFNRHLDGVVWFNGGSRFGCCKPTLPQALILHIDRRTGRVYPVSGPPLPRLLLTPAGWLPYSLNTAAVTPNQYDGFRVERMLGPAQLSFAAGTGMFADGWGRPGRRQRTRVFPGAAGRAPACLQATVTSPTPGSAPMRYELSVGAQRAKGTLAKGQATTVTISLPNRRVVSAVMRSGPAGLLSDGRMVTAALHDIHVLPCAEARRGR